MCSQADKAVAQIACPAMGITQVNTNKNRNLSGFNANVRSGRKNARMGDFFTTKSRRHTQRLGRDSFSRKTASKKRFRNYDEFATKSKGGGRFFDKDEFASRSKRKGRFRSYDEFATRTKRSKRLRDFDEFAYRRKTHRVNIDSQFAVRSTEKRFNSRKKQRSEFRTKKRRAKKARNEYTPFASSSSLFEGQKKHRQPQMGLWGGTVGKRSDKKSRPISPVPDMEKKEK